MDLKPKGGRVDEFESSRGIRGRGVNEYSRRVDEFVLLGHRTYSDRLNDRVRVFTLLASGAIFGARSQEHI